MTGEYDDLDKLLDKYAPDRHMAKSFEDLFKQAMGIGDHEEGEAGQVRISSPTIKNPLGAAPKPQEDQEDEMVPQVADTIQTINNLLQRVVKKKRRITICHACGNAGHDAEPVEYDEDDIVKSGPSAGRRAGDIKRDTPDRDVRPDKIVEEVTYKHDANDKKYGNTYNS